MISGIGTDITDVDRIKNALEKPGFERRFYTDSEREYINSRHTKSESAAGIFAAKEAVVKALGTGFSGVSFHDVEILHEENGKPFVVLHKNTDVKVQISISHEKKYAVAFAVVEKE